MCWVLGRLGRRNKVCLEQEWEMLRQNSWQNSHPELTPTNRNRSLQLFLPLLVANLGPKGHFSQWTQQKLSWNHLSAPRNWITQSWERQRRRRRWERSQPCSVHSQLHLAEFKWIKSESLWSCSDLWRHLGTILGLWLHSAPNCSDPEAKGARKCP